MISLPAGVEVLERGWLSSNNVLLAAEGGTALVDSGYWTHAPQTLALVRAALRGRSLDTLVNTHLHSDHCGRNSVLQAAFPSMRTLIPPGLAAHVESWDPVALSYEPTGQHCPVFNFDAVLRPGTAVRLGEFSWQICAAPGHDVHSVILFEPSSGVLISADALWENGFGVVFPELEADEGFSQVAATLDFIESLHPRAVIPGHGSVFKDVVGALGRARRRLEGLMRDPSRHAAHAARVLLKFKLLELQFIRYADLLSWARSTRYFALVRERYFGDLETGDWIASLVADLERTGAAMRHGDLIVNA